MTMLLRVFGIAAILMGGLWVGQGTGVIMWPASSFMLAQGQWALIGAALVLVGVFVLWRSGKRR